MGLLRKLLTCLQEKRIEAKRRKRREGTEKERRRRRIDGIVINIEIGKKKNRERMKEKSLEDKPKLPKTKSDFQDLFGTPIKKGKDEKEVKKDKEAKKEDTKKEKSSGSSSSSKEKESSASKISPI